MILLLFLVRIRDASCHPPDVLPVNIPNTNYEYLYWMEHFSFRLAVINVCPVLVSSELLLSTHLPTSEGWTAELTVGLW